MKWTSLRFQLRRRAFLVWVALVVGFSATRGTSLAGAPWLATRYNHQHWIREDGLPDNAVERLLRTRDGWLWIGTRNGLARFDGLRFTVYDERTPGFTSDAILDLAEDLEGSLWIATKKGLYRKQGARFSKFTRESGLLHDQVNQIHPMPDGSLWLSTMGGVNRFHKGRLTSFPFAETIYGPGMNGEVGRSILSMSEAEGGEFWIGSQGGLHRLAPSAGVYRHVWRAPVPMDAVQKGHVQRLLKDAKGTLWLGGEDALFRREGTGWRSLPFPVEAGDLRLRQLTKDDKGVIWAARGGKLFCAETNSLVPFRAPFELSDAYVSDVLPDDAGRLWVGTRFGGLHCLQPALLQFFTTKDGLSNNSVTSVCPAGHDGLWVATIRGVMRMRGDHFEFPPANVLLAEVNARAVFEDRAGDVWVSADASLDSSLVWLEPQAGAYRRLGTEDEVHAPSTFLEDRVGRLWIGGRRGLQCLLTNYIAEVTNFVFSEPNFGVQFHRKRASRWYIRPDRIDHYSGEYWHGFRGDEWDSSPFGSWRPLAKLPSEFVADAPFPVTTKLTHFDFRAFQHTRDGAFWIGTWGGGLLRLRDGQWTTFSTREGLVSNQIDCLHEDIEGLLWIGTPRGLSRLDPRGSRGNEALTESALPAPHLPLKQSLLTPPATFASFSFTRAHGLPDDEIHQMLEDDAGNLWIGCGEGIYRVARADLASVADGRATRVDCLLLDSADGLIAGQTASGYQPSACRTPDGRLWFATQRGLAAITPANLRRDLSLPRVFLETLRVGDREFSLLDTQPDPRDKPGIRSQPSSSSPLDRPNLPTPISLPPSSISSSVSASLKLPPGSGSSLEVQFGALEYAAPKRLTFRSRLRGQDRDWVETGSRRAAYFTNLKPGPYQFQVQAAGRDGRWIEPGASLAFVVAPYYWETGWFRFTVSFSGNAVKK